MQTGYSDKLGAPQTAATTSSMAAAFGQRAPATPASDMFLPSRPALHRSTASSAVVRNQCATSSPHILLQTSVLPSFRVSLYAHDVQWQSSHITISLHASLETTTNQHCILVTVTFVDELTLLGIGQLALS